ncbi:hypothetical protein Gorai_002640, partial [Gossypium raimondii]|nr:hypothetical protein [Gossypium raimondii]
VNNPVRHNGILVKLEDIRLTLYQQAEEKDEFLANCSIWHMKVPLIVFATVKMHESNRVMRQFRCTQCIPLQPQELNDLHKIDMQGRLEEDRETFQKKYIEIWQDMYDYLLMCEPFLIPKLATSLDYMNWFSHHGKSYLLSASKRSRQRRRMRPR